MRAVGEGFVIALIGAVAIWGTTLVPPPPQGETWAGLLPMGAALLLTATGSWMAIAGLRQPNPEADQAPVFSRTTRPVLGLFVVAVLYQQAIVLFGYELPTAVAGPVALWIFGVRSRLGLALSVVLFPDLPCDLLPPPRRIPALWRGLRPHGHLERVNRWTSFPHSALS